ncbi:MAG: hypothetical protein M3128_09610, partial [Verrucomicrobiota bacterium]|nr:hypothetical protein [Verrucomicrobiota bacterium]
DDNFVITHMRDSLFQRWYCFTVAVALGSLLGVFAGKAAGQTATAEAIVVSGEEVPSAYGAPPALSRSRFSNLVKAYVLPAGAVYAGFIYEGDSLKFDRPDHNFTEEIEIGLPYRFGLAFENAVETYRGTTQERSFSVEARYAFADWDKIPLNPTIFAEYKFGIGHILHDEGPPEKHGPGEALDFLHEMSPLPDAFEVRLLLSEEFFGKLEWALNGFFEQEVGGDRGREYGFAQSAMIPVILPKERLKVGVEMQLTTFTDKGIRDMPSYRFIIGPTIAWKPTKNTRLDISPLFGATDDAPRAEVFAVFSMLFGPGGEHEREAEAPASTRNR